MPRKTGNLTRRYGIFVYCTEEEKKLIRSAANGSRQNLSQFCLTAITDYIRTKGLSLNTKKS